MRPGKQGAFAFGEPVANAPLEKSQVAVSLLSPAVREQLLLHVRRAYWQDIDGLDSLEILSIVKVGLAARYQDDGTLRGGKVGQDTPGTLKKLIIDIIGLDRNEDDGGCVLGSEVRSRQGTSLGRRRAKNGCEWLVSLSQCQIRIGIPETR